MRPDAPADGVPPGTVRLPGLTLPGLANAHSHAFHRALRGTRQAGQGHVLDLAGADVPGGRAARPGQLPGAGPGRLRRDGAGGDHLRGRVPLPAPRPGRRPLRRPERRWAGRWSRPRPQAGCGSPCSTPATCRAGSAADGTPAPLAGTQLRFGDGDGERVGGSGCRVLGRPARAARADARLGAAIHSVRAVPPGQMHPVVAWSHALRRAAARAPVRADGRERRLPGRLRPSRRPQLLDRAGVLGPRTTVVHATHLTGGDIDAAGRSRTVRLHVPDHRGGPGRRHRPGPRAGRGGQPAVAWAATATP